MKSSTNISKEAPFLVILTQNGGSSLSDSSSSANSFLILSGFSAKADKQD